MGREANTVARRGEHEVPLRVHLDSERIELRGSLRADLAFAELGDVRVEGDWLLLSPQSGPVAIRLGAREAALWQRRIAHPPGLPEKLGLEAACADAARIGPPDAELDGLLAPFLASGTTLPQRYFVALRDSADLAELPGWLESLPAGAALWTLRVKGQGAPVKEAALRAVLAQTGWTANKTARFSAERTADRWHRRRG